jgi:integrase/ABC-type dipeptide/oligopeptide/nickel transport system ATPase component
MESMTEKQSLAFKLAKEGKSLFITGGAGVGKSYIVRTIIQELQKEKQVIVCAPTGSAAIQIGGTTIHKAFGFPASTCITTSKRPKIVERAPKQIRAADVIVIDEISMCSMSIFDAIIASVKKAERLENKAIQLIIVGDFFQLPPVIRTDNGDKQQMEQFYNCQIHNGFAFQAPAWSELDLVSVELTEVIRQTENEFVTELNLLRKGDIKCVDYFNKNSSPNEIKDAIWLYPYNKQVNQYNSKKIKELEGTEYTFTPVYSKGSGTEYIDQSEPLILKEGARVIITTNHKEDPERTSDFLFDCGIHKYPKRNLYVNGTMGEIRDIYLNPDNPLDDCLTVLLDNGEVAYIYRKAQNIYDYTVDKKNIIHKEIVGTYHQMPVLPAYAMTMHRAQGKTLEKANISPDCNTIGELYVAISRVQTIENIHFSTPLTPDMIQTDPMVCDFYDHINNNTCNFEDACIDEVVVTEEYINEPTEISTVTDVEIPVAKESFIENRKGSIKKKDHTKANSFFIPSPRFVVYNQNFELKNELYVNRQFIVIKDKYGILHFTDFHKYIRSPVKSVKNVTSNGNKRFIFIAKFLNYIFFTENIKKLNDITLVTVKSFLQLYAMCELPDDNENITRKKTTVDQCARYITDFLENLIKEQTGKCKLKSSELYTKIEQRDMRGRIHEKKVLSFEIQYFDTPEIAIFRDLPDVVFDIIFNHVSTVRRDLLGLIMHSAFAGLRPSESCNVRRCDSPLGPGIIFSKANGLTEGVEINLTKECNIRSDGIRVGNIKKERMQPVPKIFLEAYMQAYENYMDYLSGRKYEADYGPFNVNTRGMAYTYPLYLLRFHDMITNEIIPILLHRDDPQLHLYARILQESKISPHIFRHWFTVQLVLSNITDPYTIMYYRGDSSPTSAITYLQNKSELERKYRRVNDQVFSYTKWRADTQHE